MVKSAIRLIAVLAFVMTGLAGAPAQAQISEQEQLVARSRLVLDAFLSDPQFESIRVYVQNAYAVLIMPQMLKAGFLFGANYGSGVLLARDPQSGAWGCRPSSPRGAGSTSAATTRCSTGRPTRARGLNACIWSRSATPASSPGSRAV